MKTKAEIVQRLLEEKQITAEEAVILLTSNDQNTVWIGSPQWPYWPITCAQPNTVVIRNYNSSAEL